MGGDFRGNKASQPKKKFKEFHSDNTAMYTTFDLASFSNAEMLQLLTTRTLLETDFYCSL